MDDNFPRYVKSKYAICTVACAPLRIMPKDTSEMVSQLLFGECVEIIDWKNKNWLKVRCLFDGYIAWLDPKQLSYLPEDMVDQYSKNHPCSLDICTPLMNTEISYPILLGSSLPFFDGLSLRLPSAQYTFSGQVIDPGELKLTEEIIIKVAKKYLNAPYMWGGRSPFGMDCSGFTQVVFKMLGIKLRRDASQQAKEGELVAFLDAARVGDLAFFDNKDGDIVHVGIILENKMIIHASGSVRIDKLDYVGIKNVNTKRHTHKLRIIKRFIFKE